MRAQGRMMAHLMYQHFIFFGAIIYIARGKGISHPERNRSKLGHSMYIGIYQVIGFQETRGQWTTLLHFLQRLA